MQPHPDLWALAGSGLTLLAVAAVWLAPVLLAGLVTFVSETVRALRAPAPPSRRIPSRLRPNPVRAVPATSTSP